MNKKNILLFGGTGSIGDNVLDLLRMDKKTLNLHGVTCNNNFEKVKKINSEFSPNNIGIGNYQKEIEYNDIKNVNFFYGLNEFSDMIMNDVDIIILAISGIACLELALKVAESGKIIGLANKESIISLGPLFTDKCKKHNSRIVPLDSEHNSIYQILRGNKNGVKELILTASGGPFFKCNLDFLSNVTPEQAMKHPKWKMGGKISVDSSNMMNKSLELIEAKYLFNLPFSKINAIIHPQVLIHGMVKYNDSSIISFLSFPDMKISISNLFYPNKENFLNDYELDLIKNSPLEFFEINQERFPSIKLCKHIMDIGGIAPHAFNYINDKMVMKFINKEIGYLDIVNLNENLIEKYFKYNSNIEYPTIQDIKELNIWADENI